MADPVVTPPSAAAESIESRMASLVRSQRGEPAVPAAPVAQPAEPVQASPDGDAEPVQDQSATPAEGAAEGQDPTQAETAGEDDLIDIEINGKVYRAPPEFKDGVMQKADYTRKTMELADQRRLFQAEQEMGQVQAAFQKSAEPELTKLAALDSQISQFKSLDWSAMDTDQIVRARQALDTIKDHGCRHQFSAGGF